MGSFDFASRAWLGAIAMLACACAVALLSPAAAAAPPALEPLRSVRGDSPAIVDSSGREVLLRGVNVNQLGDYYQANPRLATVLPLTQRDFEEIAAVGFNTVRLLVSWSALEPEPGAFDRAYVDRVRQAVGWAREQGLYVVLDMHQDAWGKHIATEPGETCAPGFMPSVGWDGAPQWATLTDGLPTCRLGLREVSPAVGQAWQSFYDDRAGIQTALVRTWGRLAREFASESAVAGYDLLNEPNPGLSGNQTARLGEFYGRTIEAIRDAERAAAGGFEHIVFFEPGVEWSGFGVTATPPPSFTTDPNVVFSPHLYADSITVTPVTVEQGFDYAEAAAGTYASTVWSGEWGWFGDPAADRAEIARYAIQEDARLIGGAWWSWKQACGDPHVIPAPGGEPNEISPSLNRYACRPAQRPLGIPEATRRILERAYPRAAPGRLIALESDPESGAMRLAGRGGAARSCELLVWLPGGRGVPQLAGTNVERIEVRRFHGGWLARGCARSRYELWSTGFAAPDARGRRGCLARRVSIGGRGIGRVRLGGTRRRLLTRIGARPVAGRPRSYRWCVRRSGGHVTAVFARRSRSSRVALVVTSATGHRSRKVGPATSLRRLLGRFPRASRLTRGVYRAAPGSRRLFVVLRGRVRLAAVADRRLLDHPRALRRHLRVARRAQSSRS